MLWTITKWTVGLAAFALVLLTITGKKTFHVEILIPAPPAVVWGVLMDTKNYTEWNPVFSNIEGQFREGATVKTTVKEPGKPDVVLSSKVVKVVPEKHLNQLGGIKGVITFDHNWLLEPVEQGTKVTQHEVDRGFYVWFWNSDWVEPAYLKASEALRERVLSLEGI